MKNLESAPSAEALAPLLKNQFKLGDIVSLVSHPLLPENSRVGISKDENFRPLPEQVKISAYHKFTPPLMVVVEIKMGTKYDKRSGSIITQYKCTYYSTAEGKFEAHWFKEFELKGIESETEGLYELYQYFEIDKLNEELLEKQVIMTTVDLELGKINLYKDSDPAKLQFRESNLLDFLPPMGTISKISTIEPYIQYNEETGKPDFVKCRINAKIKWYNNKTDRFSEEEVPLIALKKVPEVPKLSKYDMNKLYVIEQEIALEDQKDLKIVKVPVRIQDLVFKHYQYVLRLKSLMNNKSIMWKTDVELKLLKSDFDFDSTLPFESEERDKTIKVFTENVDKWFRIIYRDRGGTYTNRIILVRKVNTLKNRDHIIEANCLLRDGAIRHFWVKNIISYKKLEKFEEEFCQ